MPPAYEHPASLSVRDERQPNYGRGQISGTTLAFLVPVFVIFIFGPILCVWVVRKLRARQGVEPPPRSLLMKASGRQPPEKREEARKKLKGVSTVSSASTHGKWGHDAASATSGKMKDGVLVLEPECAICLSALFAPSAPVLAHIASTTNEPGESSSVAPSVLEKPLDADEDILKLNVCGHEFHAECLISWFVLWKFSCPICRAVYYTKKKENAESEAEGADVEQIPRVRFDSRVRIEGEETHRRERE